jgi:DNA-binding NarL/FixJ family response regulator
MDNTHSHGLPARVRVHLLTENRLLRESLAHLLLKKASISVVGVSDNLEAAADEIAASQCEVVLTDCLATARDTKLLRDILDRDPQVKVVLFGMEESSEAFLKAMHLGVSAYVLKDASASEVVAAVLAVAQGDAVCPPKLCMSFIQHLAQQSRRGAIGEEHENGNKPSLTHRQLELVSLVARGLTNKEIAANLHLSEFTVKNHMRRILKQVDAGDRYEAVEVIRATGFLPEV